MKVKCRKCQIIFTIADMQPSDITALNRAECGSGYGNMINGIVVHEVRGHLEWVKHCIIEKQIQRLGKQNG